MVVVVVAAVVVTAAVVIVVPGKVIFSRAVIQSGLIYSKEAREPQAHLRVTLISYNSLAVHPLHNYVDS